MNWEKLKVYRKVAKAGSFLKASKQDNKSQSTFSRAVMDLEREINRKLFNRTSKGVMPTLHGSTLLNLVDDFSNKLNQFLNNNRKN
ncbi:MAG: LysR family transcriptional regulator [Candidatus Fonsibacter sp.]|nr:LysR family transcriptional regulator [Candidatus Fonsibacter sp.]